ncbi:hypothetical protein BDV06DRAFT_134296 [Aspergillus oleicola]
MRSNAGYSHHDLSKVSCRFYDKGTCRDGLNCRFAHVTPLQTWDAAQVEAAQPIQDTRSQVPCHFYREGNCRNGNICPFAHSEASTVEQTVPDEQSPNTEIESYKRVICGACVQFGDGAKILKLNALGDFSAVRLSMLPPTTSSASVAELLAALGFDIPTDYVRILPQGDSCNADIRVEDPLFAKKFCAALTTEKSTDKVASKLIAIPVSAPVSRDLGAGRVDCKKVHCSWHRPFRTVWLNFGSQDVAKQVGSRFNAGIYKVCSQQIKSSGPVRSGGYRNPLAWTLTLNDVLSTATKAEVLRDVPSVIQPRHVELGKATYDVDLDMANAMVEMKLMQVGPLDRWEPAAGSKGKRAKAKARFQTEEDARRAATSLNGMQLPFHENGRLTLQLVYSARFKVPDRIYQAVRARIQEAEAVWKSQHLVFIPYEPVGRNRVLKLEGEDTKNVVQAKNSLERILTGETAMCDGKVLWSLSLGVNGEVYRKLKDIEQRLGVVIDRNKRLSLLRIYGSPNDCRIACNLIADLLKDEPTFVKSIELDQQRFAWVCHGGFRRISYGPWRRSRI